MNLSKETISILKNFGTINQGLHFKKGNVLKTVTTHKNILAEAIIEENIPTDFGIYDLNNFLSVISLHKDTTSFEFDDRHVLIIGNGGRSKIKYRFCDPAMIVTPPDKQLTMPDPEITFELTSLDFDWIMRVASVLATPHIAVESNGTDVFLTAINLQDDSAHTEALTLPAIGNGHSFRMIFKTENLVKILPGAYDVEISSKGIAHFTNKNVKLNYWLTLESQSKYDKAV